MLTYTDNVNKFPPISDIQFLFLDFNSSGVKMKTAAWVVSNMFSKIYEFKLAKKDLIFDELFEIIATDFRIAKYCKGGDKSAWNMKRRGKTGLAGTRPVLPGQDRSGRGKTGPDPKKI